MRLLAVIALCSLQSFAALKVYTVKASGGDYPLTAQGITDALAAAAAWQGASSACDDVLIKVDPATIQGNWALPAKSQTNDTTTGLPKAEANICRKYVTVRSTGAIPDEGVRVKPSDAAALVVLEGDAVSSAPVLHNDSGTHTGYWRFVGFEVRPKAVPPASYSIIRIDAFQPVTSLAAHHIEFDRVYVHGYDDVATQRGIYLGQTTNVLIQNSYISEIGTPGTDSQAISMFGGVDLRVLNSHVEAAGENFLAGGSGVRGNSHQRLITFKGNYLFKPIKWKQSHSTSDASGACYWEGAYHRNSSTESWFQCVSGTWQSTTARATYYDVKNNFEIKAGVGVLFDGNYEHNNWSQQQPGGAIAGQDPSFFIINQSNQSNHSAGRWVRADNVVAQFNKMENGKQMLVTAVPLSTDEYILKFNNLRFEHNLVLDLHRSDPTNVLYANNGTTRGRLASLGGENTDIVLAHNTGMTYPGVSAARMMDVHGGTTASQFSPVGNTQAYGPVYVKDNVWPFGSIGGISYQAGGAVVGAIAICAGASNRHGSVHPRSRYSWQFAGNVLTKESTATGSIHADPCGANYRWPAGNTIQATATASPGSWQTYLDSGTYAALNGGAAYRTATDGSDAGADIARVNWSTETAQSGARNPYLLGFEVWADSKTLRYNALSTSACTVDVDDSAAFTSPAFSTTDAGGSQARSISISSMSLTPGFYWAKVTCDGKYKIVELRAY